MSLIRRSRAAVTLGAIREYCVAAIDDTDLTRSEIRVESVFVALFALTHGYWLRGFYWFSILLLLLPLAMCEMERWTRGGRGADKVRC